MEPTQRKKPKGAPVPAPSMRVRFVLLAMFCALVGYTEKAARRKIEEGVWTQGREYRKAPDGRVLVDLEAFERWVSS